MPQVSQRTGSRRIPELPRLGRKETIGLALGILTFVVPFLVDIPGLEPTGERMLAIFLLAIVFWVTEAIPLVATAVLIIGLEIMLVSNQAVLTVPEDITPYGDFLATLASPVIVLFMGGFLIADGAAKYRLDRNLAAVLIKPFTGSARKAILGLMAITALLSMFMSNTATTATMFAVVIPIMAALPEQRAKVGMGLSIPVAANVGGIGTPVGTPPNAIALAALAKQGIYISFLDWMLMAVPLVLVIILVAWLLLVTLFVPRGLPVDLQMQPNFVTTRAAKIFYLIVGLTVLGWMTESLHGISSSVVAFLAIVALLVTKVMDGGDLSNMSWPVLWLVSGGIALGMGVGATGLDLWILGLVDWTSLAPVVVIIGLGFLALAMSNVISNSAAANLLVPLALGLATSVDGLEPLTIAVVLAVACSLAMCLPISTPPNAIAYATGDVPTSSMALMGAIVGVLGTLLLVLLMPSFWSLLGMI